MIKAIKFELRKNIKSKKNKLLCLGFIMYVIVFTISLVYKEKEYDKNQHTICEYNLIEYGSAISINTIKLEGVDDSSELYKKIQAESNFYQSQYSSDMLINRFFSGKMKGHEKSLEEEINFTKALKMKYASMKNAFENGAIDAEYLEERGLSIDQVDREIEYIDNLLQSNTSIIINPYTLNGANFLKNFFTGANLIIILIFILLFVVDSYALELREDSYKTLYTSPIKRKTILLSKILASYMLVCFIMLMVLVIAFMIISVIFGWGKSLYPLYINQGITNLNPIITNMNQGYIQLYKLIIVDFINFMVLVLFVIVFSISLSVRSNSEMLSFGVLLTILMLSYITHSIDAFMNVNRFFNPISFIFYEDLMSYQLKVNHSYGVLLQLLLSTLLIVITTFRFKNKDLVGIKGE
ncbi:ABC transporter permease subunit [uncultured Clostridium sp.]|uniref:ABC transporter permease subunit n=1 Tax=uncultured Clostridium sp. TaxID=59620 RepID=UPI0032164203